MAVSERDDPDRVETSTEATQPELRYFGSGSIKPNDLNSYRASLARLSVKAESVERIERILGSREKIIQQEHQDIINHSIRKQIDHKTRQANFLLIQQATARLISISVGLYLLILSDVNRSLFSHPVGILFLLLGVSGPLGYTFSEINQLLGGLEGFWNLSPSSKKNLRNPEDEEEKQ